MKNLKVSLITLCLFVLKNSICQTSFIQDKAGESSIIFEGNQVNLNAEDASASFSLSHYDTTNFYYGFSGKFKSTDGVATLLEGYNFKPSVAVAIYGGNILKSQNESTTQDIFYSAKLTNMNFSLLTNDSSNHLNSGTFTGYTLSFGYNRLSSFNIFKKDGLGSSYILGISTNFGVINNLNDLKPVDVSTSFVVNDTDRQSILLKDKKSGFEGEYKTSSALSLNIDYYIYPQILGGNIAAGGYLRSQLSGNDPRTNAGIGLLFGGDGAPSNISLGVLYQFDDVFNQRDSEDGLIKRSGINIVAGYSF